jgi:hypothetical protein
VELNLNPRQKTPPKQSTLRKNPIKKPMTRPPLERMQRIFRITKEGSHPSRI